MAEWKTQSLSDLIPVEDAENIVDVAEAATDALENAQTLISAAIDLMKANTTPYIDPVEAALRLVVQEVERFVLDFEATGGYGILIPPKLVGRRSGTGTLTQVLPPWWPTSMSMDQFLDKLGSSFYDDSDPQRPLFTPSSAVCGVVGVASTVAVPSEAMINFIDAIWYLLGLPFFREIRDVLVFAVNRGINNFMDIWETPPPGSAGFLSVNYLPAEEISYIEVDNGNKFPTQGQVWIRDYKHWTWWPSVPLPYFSKSANRLWFKNSDLVTIYGGMIDRTTFPTGNAWATYSSSFITTPTVKPWGEDPDWYRFKSLGEMFGVTYDIIQLVKGIGGTAQVGLAGIDALESLQALIEARAQALSDLIDRLKAIIEALPPAILETRFNTVLIEEATGVDDFMEQVRAAADRPEFDSNSVSVGFCLLAGAAGVTLFKTYFG